ncbi:unnamed protein product [Linum trigynum]|uniref:Uncharacterized protein n=1 Tax=Linum trigynum TaxID=586398 RepID=A0AAV2CF70_9ROSI
MATLPQQYAEQQQPPPPAIAYPDTAHSNGSFGTVFIVLAVIIVVSAVACCLGRVCSKSKHGGKEHKQGKKKKDKNKHQNSKVGQSDDIEFGFDKGGGGGFPPMGRPVLGKREGPNGPHFKQPSAAAESNHNGPYFPYGPPLPPPPANHQQSVHRGGVNGMTTMNGGGHQQKNGYGGGNHNTDFKGYGRYPTMEFHDGEPS